MPRVSDRGGPVSDTHSPERSEGPRQPAKHVGHDDREASKNAERDRMAAARDQRWWLRDQLRRVTKLDRLALCGVRRAMAGRDADGRAITADPYVRLSAETGLARWGGIQRCGSVWVCPPCQAKIRRKRNEEVRTILQGHLAGGGGALFGTHTLRHKHTDPLALTIAGAANAWRSVQQNRAYRRFRDAYPHRFVRSLELPYGANGWHPHLHMVCLTDTVWSDDVIAAFAGLVQAAWIKAAKRLTGRAPSAEHGAQWERAHNPREAADYVCKLQEGLREWDAAAELTRADLKKGRGSLMPLDIAALAVTGRQPAAVMLWREYEKATHGRQAITFGRGLRDQYLAEPDLTDDEIAARDERNVSEIIGYAVGRDWTAVRRQKMLHTMLLAVEAEGLDGFWRILMLARRRDRDWIERRKRVWRQYDRNP